MPLVMVVCRGLLWDDPVSPSRISPAYIIQYLGYASHQLRTHGGFWLQLVCVGIQSSEKSAIITVRPKLPEQSRVWQDTCVWLGSDAPRSEALRDYYCVQREV